MKTLPPLKTGKARTEFGHVRPLEDDAEIPFAIIESAEPGPCLVITAGVHGSEFCTVEAAVRLMQTRPQDIKGTLVVLPIVNIQGFHKRSIYVMPQDGKNLNRMFPGNADGTTSERLAHWLVTNVYPQADAYIDLHGGDLDEQLAPFTIFPGSSEKSKELAVAFGLPTLVASARGGGTIHAAAALGVPSILPEVSGNGLWGEQTVTQVTDGVRRVMRHIGMVSTATAPASEATKIVSMWVPAAPHTGLWYSHKEVSDKVAKDEVLGEIKGVFGEVLATIRSEQEGFVLYRLTSLSVNQGEALIGIGTSL
ncbi:succinylglutamate desuccinylase/aspartoacylase family protein [Chelatococcus sp. GCM10030263]|uniref:succinylglutamate desuccinylase/aspartoacylase family protein n=1 Tax=Chelatococcus sp. GCM10030263 TaxID=3273387 RepID=UPI00361C23DB